MAIKHPPVSNYLVSSKAWTRMLTLSANASGTSPAPLSWGWWAEGPRFTGTREKKKWIGWPAVLCSTISSCAAASNPQCRTREQHLDSTRWRRGHKYDNADSGGLQRRQATFCCRLPVPKLILPQSSVQYVMPQCLELEWNTLWMLIKYKI